MDLYKLISRYIILRLHFASNNVWRKEEENKWGVYTTKKKQW